MGPSVPFKESKYGLDQGLSFEVSPGPLLVWDRHLAIIASAACLWWVAWKTSCPPLQLCHRRSLKHARWAAICGDSSTRQLAVVSSVARLVREPGTDNRYRGAEERKGAE